MAFPYIEALVGKRSLRSPGPTVFDKSRFHLVRRFGFRLMGSATLYLGILPWVWKKGGPYLAIYLWGFIFVLSLVMMTLHPVLIAPRFNEFTPCKTEEVVAVIAHELGHWKLNHHMYSFIAVQFLRFLQFGGYTLVRNWSDLFRSFGFDAQPVLIGLIIFLGENLSAVKADPLYAIYHCTHPPQVERLAAIDKPDKKAD